MLHDFAYPGTYIVGVLRSNDMYMGTMYDHLAAQIGIIVPFFKYLPSASYVA
jgi:hypothetical protein